MTLVFSAPFYAYRAHDTTFAIKSSKRRKLSK
jgi:hypothetical protein